ncbi:hypothetical protein Ddye_014018 [Dipteronia dyeriana]|uniref:Uncharacterized protein n=1 Tax=Dipteronia dyeriana TaxID=168575 RepID=A0AAE0CK64_9ROSI|nr:hypothetical protein Ddye_014018 [Dipteronia dyeriana]
MENHNNTSFSIEKKVVLVKPSKTTPSHALSLSTIDNDLLLRVLNQTIYVYKSNNIISTTQDHNDHERKIDNKKTDPASLIEKALSDVLVFYYPLAGMMKKQSDGKLQINCNAIGVPFLVANADCQLSSLDYLHGIEVDVKTAQMFLFDFPSDPNEGEHPLVVQVTKFACGGFTIGMGLSHSICDGSGAAQFFRAMTELASGKSEPSIKPVWERQKLVAKAPLGTPKFIVDPASLATSPFLPTDDILHACFNVNAESIKRLRMDLIKECEGDHVHQTQGNFYFTTFEVLTAYVWRSRFRAMKLSPDAKTLICLAMNIRSLLNPPLPDGYYGNSFINANAVLTGKDLNEKPLSETANVIKECKKSSSTNEYIYTTLELLEREKELTVMLKDVALAMTDCRHLGLFEDIDFGWGDPVNLVLVPCDDVDLCLFWPPNNVDPSMKGGVRVHVTLPRAAMPKFKEEMDALKVQEDHNDNALEA